MHAEYSFFTLLWLPSSVWDKATVPEHSVVRVPVSSRSNRPGSGIVALVKCTDRWLRFLIRIGSEAGPIAPDITSRLWRKVMRDPATITPDDVAALMSDGYTQSAVFNLILGAASASALLRLGVGMRVIPVSSCAPQIIC